MMLGMKRQDLEELYQLLALYAKSYGGRHAEMLLQEVSERYSNSYGGDSISEKGTPERQGGKDNIQKKRSPGLGNLGRKVGRSGR